MDFTDRPDANPGEPFICLADAILWRVDVRSTESGKPPEEELLAAEQDIRAAHAEGRLPIFGYRRGNEDTREDTPSDALAGLRLACNDGQPASDWKRYGARCYGAAYVEYVGATPGPVAWTGLCLRKRDLLAEFARGREPEPANDVSPRAPAQRRLRSDISASDDAHAIRINRLRPTFNNLKRSGDLPTTALGRYHALFEVEPEKVNAIGKRSTFCAILEDRNPRVLRLIALGRVEPYWRDDCQNSPS